MRTVEQLMGTGLPGNTANLLGVTIQDNVRAFGATQDTAPVLTASICRVVSVAAGVADGVKLPDAASFAGAGLVVINNSPSPLKVYPASGQTINLSSENAPLVLAGTTIRTFYNMNAKDWAAR